MSAVTTVPAGWHRPKTDFADVYTRKYGVPDDGAMNRMQYIAAYTKDAIRHGNETTFETGYGMFGWFMKQGQGKSLPPLKLINPGGAIAETARDRVTNYIQQYKDAHPGPFAHLNPAKLISAAADVVSAVAPFVKTALSAIPLAGSLVSVAESLAKGRPLTDAFLDAAVSAVPGGPAVQVAAKATLAALKGKNITDALIDEVKSRLPPGLHQGADFAIAVAHGRNLQDAAIDTVKSMASDQLKNIKIPIPAGIDVPLGERSGFKVALGVLNNTKLPNGVALTPAAALAIRKRLSPGGQAGFDRAMGMRALKNYRNGSAHVPTPRPNMKGATAVLQDGRVMVL